MEVENRKPRAGLTPSQLLELIPQQAPFRFVDEIQAVNELKISGSYRFRETEAFYAGHFPNKPVTPGVILLESMVQVGVVALGIYLMSLELPPEEVSRWTTFFSDAQVEYVKPVFPGEQVYIEAERIFWRRHKLRCRIEMHDRTGVLIATATASGMGVKND
jgi:3-hydroxyacyl-[acyl-carrier-protein] dehydratase